MKGFEVYLKSGASFTVEASELSTGRDRANGELAKMNWTTPDGAKRRLHTLTLSEVIAVVVLS